MITTIIRNFLSNAVKFSNPGGKIYLNVRNTAAEQVISVEDEGIGMSVEDVQKLFRIDVKNKQSEVPLIKVPVSASYFAVNLQNIKRVLSK